VNGWKVGSASLLLFLISGDVPKTLNISPIGAQWEEAKPQEIAKHIFGKGETHSCAVESMQQGWVRVTIPPSLIEAMAGGKAYGIAIEQGARQFNGRAPVFRQPYLLVDGEPR
jgi:hypothetical protein